MLRYKAWSTACALAPSREYYPLWLVRERVHQTVSECSEDCIWTSQKISFHSVAFLCQAPLCSFLLLVLNCFFLSVCFFWDLAPSSTSFYSLNDEDNNWKLLASFPSYGAAGFLSDYSWNVVDFPHFEDSRDHFAQSVMFLHWLLCICILFSPKILFPFFSPFPCLWDMPIRCRWFFYQIRSFFWFKATEKGIFPLLWSLKEADVKYFPEKVALGDFRANFSLF